MYGDDKRKKSLALKASSSFDDNDDELDHNKSKEDEDFWVRNFKEFYDKRETKRRKDQYLKGKIKAKMSKEDHPIILVPLIHNPLALNAKN